MRPLHAYRLRLELILVFLAGDIDHQIASRERARAYVNYCFESARRGERVSSFVHAFKGVINKCNSSFILGSLLLFLTTVDADTMLIDFVRDRLISVA